MNSKNAKTRIIAVVLSVMMLLVGMPIEAQAEPANYHFEHQNSEGSWVPGNIDDYSEGDYVPHRVVYPAKGMSNQPIIVGVDYKHFESKTTTIGFDEVTDWYIGPASTTTAGAIHYEGGSTFTVSNPTVNKDRNPEVLRYTLTINPDLLSELNSSNIEWAIYFQAHLSKTGYENLVTESLDPDFGEKIISRGSGYFNGSTLHSVVIQGDGEKSLMLKLPKPPTSTPSIDVEKYVSIDGGETWNDADAAPGPFLTSGTDPVFKFVVKNMGNVGLSNVTLRDSVFNIDDNEDKIISIGILSANNGKTGGPDEYVLIYDDALWAAGQHTNTATASGFFGEVTYTDTDDTNYYGLTPNTNYPAIDVEKYVSVDGGETWNDADTTPGPFLTSGTNPQFKFVVKNIGNVALSDVTLEDSVFNIDENEDKIILIGNLAANDGNEGGLDEYTLIYDDAQWAAGQHTNTATASGFFGEVTYTDTDDANYYGLTPNTNYPAIDVEKYVSIDGGETWNDADAAPGPTLTSGTDPQFRFVVKNIGNVALSDVTLEESDFNIDEENEDKVLLIGDLAANGDENGLDEYTFTFDGATWTAGQHTNTATASGYFNEKSYTDTDDANYYGLTPNTDYPAIDVEKYVSIDGGETWNDADAAPGPTLTRGTDPKFKFVVKNTGNVALSDVTLEDSDFNIDEENEDKIISIGNLAAKGEETEVPYEYVLIYDAPWAAGQHTNTATVRGFFNEEQSYTDTDDANYFGDEPGNPPTDTSRYRLTIEKEADVDEFTEAGDVINYTITLENGGNRPLTGVKVTDPLIGSLNGPEGDSDDDNRLDVDETWIYTGEYTVTEKDVENGSITNTATARSNETNSVDDSVTVTRTEDETEVIPEPETPLGGETEVPEEIIEETPVPQATLPDTGNLFNNTMLFITGTLFIISGLVLNKKKKIRE